MSLFSLPSLFPTERLLQEQRKLELEKRKIDLLKLSTAEYEEEVMFSTFNDKLKMYTGRAMSSVGYYDPSDFYTKQIQQLQEQLTNERNKPLTDKLIGYSDVEIIQALQIRAKKDLWTFE